MITPSLSWSRSERAHNLLICYSRHGDHVRHYHIKEDCGQLYISDRHRYPTVSELINYHQHNSGGNFMLLMCFCWLTVLTLQTPVSTYNILKSPHDWSDQKCLVAINNVIQLTWTLGLEYYYRTGCWNVSHCQQQSYSEQSSPGQSCYTYLQDVL